MNENAREATFEEYMADFIIYILAMDTAFGVKRDLIGRLLGISYRYEKDVADATRKQECES